MRIAIPSDQMGVSETDMPSMRFAIAAVMCSALLFGQQARASTNAVSHVDRTLGKEPVYQSAPQYSLITLGNRGDVHVWMVEDGRRLFVDKNANGDLTDDGPPIEPSNVRRLDANQWDFEYLLDAVTPTNGAQHRDFVLRRWNYGAKEDSYGLSLSVDGRMPMYAGWFGTFWSTNREHAPVIHFGGPLTPKMLRRTEFTLGESQQRMSLCFINPGSGEGAVSRLSIDALPGFVVPELTIEWPTSGDRAPLRTSHPLTQRCCYWEFYTTEFAVPKGVVTGKAKVSVDLPLDVTLIELTTREMVVPVVAPPKAPDSER